MTGFEYLAALLLSTAGMLVIDFRYRLFFFKDWLSASIVTALGLVFFLVWDAFGIAMGIFFRGPSEPATGIVLAPEMPLEEPVFLVFLSLCTMVLYTGSARLLEWRRARRGDGAGADEGGAS